MKPIVTIVTAISILLFATATGAQTPTAQPHAVAQSGGGKSTNANFQLQSTVGQPIAGLISGGTNTHKLGFLHLPRTLTQPNTAPSATAQTATALEDIDTTITLAGTDPESGAITAIISTLPGNGLLFQTADGTTRGAQIVAVPTTVTDASRRVIYISATNGNGNGHGNFGFKVNDGALDSPEATATVNVTDVNDPPTLTPIGNPAAIQQNAGAQTINLTGIGAGGTETQTLTITATSSNTALIPNPTVTYTSPNATGTLTYTPVANANGTATITVSITDNGGTANGGVDAVTQTFTVSVSAPNANVAPTLAAITNTAAILEDAGAQTVNLTGIGTGGESQTLTLSATSSNTALIPNPTVTYTSPNATGTLTYTPVANASGSAIITVTVTDNGGTANGGVDAVSQTFTVTVTEVNDAPTLTAIADPAAILEDAGQQTVNLTDIINVETGQTLSILATSSNTALIPNPTVTYTSPNTTSTLTYTPVANASGTATITVIVTDNGGTTNGGVDAVTQTFIVTVTAVNDVPTLAAISNPPAINQDSGQQIINLSGISAGTNESQTLTITAVSNNTGLIPHPAISYTSPNPTGSIAYTPVSGASGSANITVTVTDNGGTDNGGVNSASRTFTVNVNAVTPPSGGGGGGGQPPPPPPPPPPAPTIADIEPQTAVEGNPFVFTVPVNSADLSNVTISVVSFTSQITGVQASGRTITATPGPGQFTAEIVVQATDNNGVSQPKTIQVTWGPPPNQPPVIADIAPQTAPRGTPITFEITFTDENPEGVTISVATFTRALISDIQISGNSITLTPILGSFSTEIEIQATDSQGLGSLLKKVELTWAPPANTPPVFVDDAFFPADSATNVAFPLNLSWNATDADNNTLVYTVRLGQSADGLEDRATDLTETTFTFTSEPNLTWFWQILVTDGTLSVPGPILSFTVRGDMRAPTISRIDIESNVNTVRITFTTDEPATSSVRYSTEQGLAEFITVAGSSDLKTSHAVSIPSLEAATTYYFVVVSSDKDNNEGTSDILIFTTLTAPDIIPAEITGPIIVALGHNTATIRWQTNERTVGSYALTGGDTPLDGLLQEAALEHFITFTDLQPETEYTFALTALDPAGNPTPATITFTTRTVPDTRPPAWVQRPQAAPADVSAQITFEVSEPVRAIIEYGSNANSLDKTLTLDTGIAFTAELINLTANTEYAARVTLTDLAGNKKQSGLFRFKTEPEPDTVAPLVLGTPETRGIAQDRATVAWSTNELAYALVIFDTGEIVDASPRTPLSDGPATEHTYQLTGLLPNTRYNYQVVSVDLAGNRTIAAGGSFTTLEAPDLTPPQLTTPITPSNISFNHLTVEWETAEAAKSVITATPVVIAKTQVPVPEIVTKTQTDLVLVHKVQIFGLVPGTFYSITVHLEDAVGNGIEIAIDPIQTLVLPDIAPPVFVQRPRVSVKHNQATISWEANEPVDGFVTFAQGSDFTNARTVGTSAFGKLKVITLTGLLARTLYSYTISSTDVEGNGPTVLPEPGRTLTFTTTAGPDKVLAVITGGPTIESITEDGVTLSLRTNEPVTARLRISQNEDALGTAEGLFIGSLKSEHRLDIRQLQSDTQYGFLVEVFDAAKNGPTTSIVRKFRTKKARDRKPPRITSGPVALNVTPTTALVVWSTDEPSNSEVIVRNGPHIRDAEQTRDHRVLVTGLPAVPIASKSGLQSQTADQRFRPKTYRYEIKSTDAAGNAVRKTRRRFTTPGTIDTRPPEILEGPVVSYRSNNRATFSLRADESTHMEIVVGSEEDFATGNTLPTVFSRQARTKHDITVTGLVAGTAYRYRVVVTDGAGNQTVDGILTGFITKPGVVTKFQPPGGGGAFTTATEADTQFPVIIEGPNVVAALADALTIEWTTDENADSGVNFGIDDLLQRTEEGSDVQTHRVVLTGLDPATTYQYHVESTDPAGNGATQSRVFLAKTAATADENPPRITTAPKIIYLTERAATLSWETDEGTETFVEYGIDSLDTQNASPDYVRAHQITLTNLAPTTTYRYQISATDEAGNGPVTSKILTFTTETSPDRTPPELVALPSVFTTESAATITWETQEMSDSAVRFAPGDGIARDALGQVEGSARDAVQHQVVLTNLLPNTTYTYVVQSIDRSNNGPTESAPLTFKTAAGKDEIPPGVPENLIARNGQGEIALTWTAPADPDIAGYDILRAVAQGEFEPIATRVTELIFRDSGLDPALTYRYQLRAVDRAANTGISTEAVTATPDGSGFPAAPTARDISGDPLKPLLSVENVLSPIPLTYGFQIATDEAFEEIVAQTTGIAEGSNTEQESTTAWAVDILLEEGTTYYWRSWVSDGIFTGPFMPPRSFRAGQMVVNNPGDFNGDLSVGFTDFVMFAGGFGSQAGDARYLPILDLNSDSVIDFTDFIAFASLFGMSYN